MDGSSRVDSSSLQLPGPYRTELQSTAQEMEFRRKERMELFNRTTKRHCQMVLSVIIQLFGYIAVSIQAIYRKRSDVHHFLLMLLFLME